MSKTSRRNAIVVSVLIVALCAAVIGGATFALYSAGDTHNITVTSGDIQLSSTVKLTSAWTTAQSGEKTDANVTDNKTAALSTGGKVSVDEGGNITFDRIALGDGATFEVTLSMAYTINMKYSLALLAEESDSFLCDNLQIKVGDKTSTMQDSYVYIVDWTESAIDDKDVTEKSVTVSFDISLPWTAQASAPSSASSIKLSLVASGVQTNALTGISNAGGGNYGTLEDAVVGANADDTIIIGEDMDETVWTAEAAAAAADKDLVVIGSKNASLTAEEGAVIPSNVTLRNLNVNSALNLQSGASLEDVTVNGSVTVNGASSRAAVMSLANESQVSGGKSVFNGVTFKEGLVLNNADVTITNSTIDDYNGTAVYVTGGSLTLGDGNYFSAVGPNSVIAAFGATVTITGGEYVAAADMATNTGLNYQDGKALALYSNSSATISGGKLDSRANNQTVQLGSFDEDNPETNTSASLTFTGGEITSYNVGIAIFNSSSFVMDGGSIAADAYAVSSNNLAGSDIFTIDINGGSITSPEVCAAFYLPAPGTLTLDNCTVTAGAIIDALFGDITIGSGVTLKSTATSSHWGGSNVGMAEGSAIILNTSKYTVKPAGTAGSLTLAVADGANITSATGRIFGVYNWTNADKEDVSLNFGSFAGDKDAIAYYNAASATSVTRMRVIPAAVDGKYGAVGYATLAEASTAGVTKAEIIYDLNDTSSSSVNVTIWEGVNVTGANVGSLTARGANTLENVTAAENSTLESSSATYTVAYCAFNKGVTISGNANVTGGAFGSTYNCPVKVDNGSTVTFDKVTMALSSTPAIQVLDSSNVTITGSTLSTITANVLTIDNSTVTVSGTTMTSSFTYGGNYNVITVKNYGEVNLSGCTISTTATPATVAGAAIHASTSSSVTLSETSVTAKTYGIAVFANCSATITDSQVNANLALYVYGDNAEIVVDGSNSAITSTDPSSDGVAVQAGAYTSISSYGGGSFTLKNGKVEGAILAAGTGEITINGGSVHSSALAVSNNNTTAVNTSITINGGIIEADGSAAIYLPGQGSFTMTGGSVTGNSAIDARLGSVTITGGTLTAKYNDGTPLGKGDVQYVTGMAFSDGSVIVVNSGIYKNIAGELVDLTVTIGNDVVMNKTADNADYVRHYNYGKNEQKATVTMNASYNVAYYTLVDGTPTLQPQA